MTVDVIVPVYNNVGLVRDCLDSVLRSRCSTKFDLIVFDDASPEPEVKELLGQYSAKGAIQLFTNQVNLGFTRTVNLAMRLHEDRDVLLLNSDTVVYGDWLDRLARAAYSDDRVATANPLTNSNGSHISYYPAYVPTEHLAVEVEDAVLNQIAAEVNDRKYARVHTTVGFCMYIKRACLDDIGYFDSINFPVGYGEESDFCYRAVKMGWRHLIVGDAFVTHLEGKSFGKRKLELMNSMFARFGALHPEAAARDKKFREEDPVRGLRASLDLARVKRLVNNHGSIHVYVEREGAHTPPMRDGFCLIYAPQKKKLRFAAQDIEKFPNLESYTLPRDLAAFNKAMSYLDVGTLYCETEADAELIRRDVSGMDIELQLGPKLVPLGEKIEAAGPFAAPPSVARVDQAPAFQIASQTVSSIGTYPVVFLEALPIEVGDRGAVRNKEIQIAFGLRADGSKEALDLWVEQNEGSGFRPEVIRELRGRGVKEVLVVVADCLKGFPDAVGEAFPEAMVQTCVVQLLRRSLDLVPYGDRKSVMGELKEVCSAADLAAGEAALRAFERGRWGDKYPEITDTWRRIWGSMAPFFGFPPELRSIFLSVEGGNAVNFRIRREMRELGPFASDEAARNALSVMLQQAEPEWSTPSPKWSAAKAEFARRFGERFPQAA